MRRGGQGTSTAYGKITDRRQLKKKTAPELALRDRSHLEVLDPPAKSSTRVYRVRATFRKATSFACVGWVRSASGNGETAHDR